MMASVNVNSLAIDLLHIFERTLSFLQNIGAIQAYSFSYSDVFFFPSTEKYLENFIAILEEIKDVLNKLQIHQKCTKSNEVGSTDASTNLVPNDLISPSHFIQAGEIFVPEQLITPHDELGSLLNNDYVVPEIITEPATDSSWIPAEEKEDEACDKQAEAAKEQFLCPVCNKVLGSKNNLQLHQATHSGQKPLCCEHCGKLFTTNLNLAAHLTRQHNLNTESANSCKECGKLFVRRSALEMHMKSHRGVKPWACEVCKKTFTQKVTRDTHQLSHTRDYRFTCNDCGKQFPTQAKLTYHMKTHGEPQHECQVCDRKFTLKTYLTAHYRTHDVLRRPATGQCRLDTVANQVVENSSFSCGQCGRSFPSSHTLSLHSQKHNSLSTCYRYTERRKMAPKQKHACGVCGKEFLLKSSLSHHHRQKHTTGLTERQRRPYCCHLCHKSFTTRAKARLHMQIHTQQAQHGCAVCGRLFRRKDSLQRHMTRVHGGQEHTSQKQPSAALFKCSQCERAFKSKPALSFHTQTHEGKFKHQCNMCGKQFVRKCHYRGHLLSHSTDRPYKCDSCGKGFKDNKTCREHTKRVHSTSVIPTTSGEQLSVNQNQMAANEMSASQMAIHTLLAGDDATYGQTYDQFQACVQLQ